VGLAIILCIDPGAVEPGGLERLLQEMGHGPVRCHRLDQAYHALDAGPVDLILTASRLPDGTPLDLLERLRDRALDVPVIVMAAHGDVDDAAEVMKQGALDYLTLPPRAEAVRLAVGQALQNLRLRRENSDFRRQIEVLRGELDPPRPGRDQRPSRPRGRPARHQRAHAAQQVEPVAGAGGSRAAFAHPGLAPGLRSVRPPGRRRRVRPRRRTRAGPAGGAPAPRDGMA